MIKFSFFYGTVFLAFGLGVKLTQLSKMPNGYIFLGLGFLLLTIFVILLQKENKESKK